MKKQTTSKVSEFKFSGKRFPLVDATEDLIFEVKQPDVNGAKKGDPNNCPAACAIKKVSGDAFVSRDIAKVLRPVKGVIYAFRYRLSAETIKAVKKFDAEGIFPLGQYRLKAITPSQTLAAKRTKAKNKTVAKKRNVRPHIKYMVRAMQPAKFA